MRQPVGSEVLRAVVLGYNVAHYLLLVSCWFLVWLTFDSEDGGDMFLQNAGWLSKDYMALKPRR
jgi:hypothetical protein